MDFNNGIREFQNKKGAILLDVREAEEYRRGHVPGSKNISVNQLNKVQTFIKTKDTPIYIYCQSGSRSYQAESILKSMGYQSVKSLGAITSYKGKLERS